MRTHIRTSIREHIGNCDIWDTLITILTNWEPGFMTIFVTWQLIATLDSIRNSCNVCIITFLFILINFKGFVSSNLRLGWCLQASECGILFDIKLCNYFLDPKSTFYFPDACFEQLNNFAKYLSLVQASEALESVYYKERECRMSFIANFAHGSWLFSWLSSWLFCKYFERSWCRFLPLADLRLQKGILGSTTNPPTPPWQLASQSSFIFSSAVLLVRC